VVDIGCPYINDPSSNSRGMAQVRTPEGREMFRVCRVSNAAFLKSETMKQKYPFQKHVKINIRI